MEAAILLKIQAVLGSPLLDWLMPFLSWLGDSALIWFVFALFLLVKRETRPYSVKVVLALAFSLLLCNLLLKPLIERPRPFEVVELIQPLIAPPRDASFPSGHTSASFAAAVAMLGLGKRWTAPAFALAALIGFSRLYVCVHWPSDVLCGVVLGVLCGVLARRLYPRLEPWLQKTGLL